MRLANDEAARTAIGVDVQDARNQWIESNLITEALALELIDIALDSKYGLQNVGSLRALANVIERDRAALNALLVTARDS